MKRGERGVKQAGNWAQRWAMGIGIAFLANDRMVVLNPKGPIADAQRGLIIDAFTTAMLVIVPVILWRSGSPGATGPPTGRRATSRNGPIDADRQYHLADSAAIVVTRGRPGVAQHPQARPYRPIASDVPPLNPRVVGRDWKWLFIYPEQVCLGQPDGHPRRPADQPPGPPTR